MSLFKVLRGDGSRIDTDTTPFHDGWAYFTPDDGGFYIDAETDGKQQRVRVRHDSSTPKDITLTASGWDGGKQTVAIDGLTAKQDGVVGLSTAITADQYDALAAAKISIAAQDAGSLTFSCLGELPKIDVPLTVILFD